MTERTISGTPLFASAFSTSFSFCRIPTRPETRNTQHPRSFLSLCAVPFSFIQRQRGRFVSTPQPHSFNHRRVSLLSLPRQKSANGKLRYPRISWNNLDGHREFFRSSIIPANLSASYFPRKIRADRRRGGGEGKKNSLPRNRSLYSGRDSEWEQLRSWSGKSR